MKKKYIHIDTLIEKYMQISSLISQSNETLLSGRKGFLGNKLKSNLLIARGEYKKYCAGLEELEIGFVGDLEVDSHSDLAYLSIKDTNYKVASRARSVCIDNLTRFEKTLITIEDSFNFNLSIKLAWISIGVAILSVVANFIGS